MAEVGRLGASVQEFKSGLLLVWSRARVLHGLEGDVGVHSRPDPLGATPMAAHWVAGVDTIWVRFRVGGQNDSKREAAHEEIGARLSRLFGSPRSVEPPDVNVRSARDRSWFTSGLTVEHRFVDEDWGCSRLDLRC